MNSPCGSLGGAGPSSIGKMLADVVAKLDRDIDLRTKKLGVSGSQWVILMRIGSEDGPTASDLCRAIGYDSGSMTRMLDRLERLGLIVRERCEHDRRLVRLVLAEAGRALHKELCPIVEDVLNQHLKGFSSAEAAQLKKFLRRILDVGNGS